MQQIFLTLLEVACVKINVILVVICIKGETEAQYFWYSTLDFSKFKYLIALINKTQKKKKKIILFNDN